MKNKTNIALIGAIIVVVALIIGFSIANKKAESPDPNEQVQNPFNAEISVSNILNGQNIQLPFTAMGQIKGNWFFEGSFPVYLKDGSGNQIGVGIASSTSDWMTTNMIPFTVVLPAVNYQGPGSIVFHNDNASGEPINDKSYTLQVVFQ